MEESRLKPMKPGYDEKLFVKLFEETRLLRHSLARGIDTRRFGVDHEEVVSWFDVKFIYAFNRYCDEKTPDLLKAYIINALRFFKIRVIKSAYTVAHSQSILCIDDVFGLEDSESEDPEVEQNQDELLDRTMHFMKQNLSDNALMLLEIQLQPPLWVQKKAAEEGIHNFTKIPNALYAEYLELGTGKQATKMIEYLKQEINSVIRMARSHFNPTAGE